MKRIILILLCIFFTTQTYAGEKDRAIKSPKFEFYIFGINLKWLKDAKIKDYTMMFLGGVICACVHEGGHAAYLEMNDIDYHFEQNFKHLTARLNPDVHSMTRLQKRHYARAGYICDTVIGLALTTIPSTRNSYFTRGYTLTHSIGLITIKERNEYIDFEQIEKNGGNGDLFKGIVSSISAHNLLRQEW